ncbi:MAG: hypothetical protein HQM01_07935 [Magnetococcales bacterium]|nr:hypothetical protein [Magnetococcales bacterium]
MGFGEQGQQAGIEQQPDGAGKGEAVAGGRGGPLRVAGWELAGEQPGQGGVVLGVGEQCQQVAMGLQPRTQTGQTGAGILTDGSGCR